MAEIVEITRGIDSKHFWENLAPVDVSNVQKTAESIKNKALERGLDIHLLAVGGAVDPTKRATPRKDIDLVLYCPDLAIENSPSAGVKNFDKFESFVTDALNFDGWSHKTVEPFWQDWDISSDGLIAFTPRDGTPIEVLPTRSDVVGSSFEEYLAKLKRPFSLLF